MYDFTYHCPASLDEAAKLLSGSDDGSLIAGGQTLIPTLKQRLANPSDVVDISRLADLGGIKAGKGAVEIGAAVTHAEVAGSKDVAKHIAALAGLAGGIGDPHVRHRGTLGGSIANNDPAADYPAACVGLGATIHTNSGSHTADDFFTGMFETALDDGEIVTRVSFPVPKKAGYGKFANPASRYAIVGVFVAETPDGVRVAVTGAGPSVFRVAAMEEALSKSFTSGALEGITVPADDLNSDLHAGADYRAHLIGVMARRAVDQANG